MNTSRAGRAPMTRPHDQATAARGTIFRNELTDYVLLEQEAGSSVPANPCAQKHPKRHHYPGSLTASDTHWTAGMSGGKDSHALKWGVLAIPHSLEKALEYRIDTG